MTRGLLIQAIDLFATIDEQLRVKISGHPERYTRPHMRIGTGRALICARSRFWAA